ncbi:hypothetical protein Tco_0678449 [Tanacetum coccineum]|uniref:Uncharacterized protein n=1 Tax=Tanacetum coccineum TaxID=301880 RepID=A0ABQ4XF28_9ASTR
MVRSVKKKTGGLDSVGSETSRHERGTKRDCGERGVNGEATCVGRRCVWQLQRSLIMLSAGVRYIILWNTDGHSFHCSDRWEDEGGAHHLYHFDGALSGELASDTGTWVRVIDYTWGQDISGVGRSLLNIRGYLYGSREASVQISDSRYSQGRHDGGVCLSLRQALDEDSGYQNYLCRKRSVTYSRTETSELIAEAVYTFVEPPDVYMRSVEAGGRTLVGERRDGRSQEERGRQEGETSLSVCRSARADLIGIIWSSL